MCIRATGFFQHLAMSLIGACLPPNQIALNAVEGNEDATCGWRQVEKGRDFLTGLPHLSNPTSPLSFFWDAD